MLFLPDGDVVFSRLKIHCHAESQRDNEAGDQRAREHLGDAGAHCAGIHDHGDAGRDDGAQRAACGDQAVCHFFGVAALHHGQIQNAADGADGGGAGAGQCGKDRARHNGHDAQTAPDAAQQHADPIHQPLGDTALFHQVSGQREQRHRQTGNAVKSRIAPLGHQDQRPRVGDDQVARNGGDDGKRDGHTKEEQYEQNNNDHSASPSFPASTFLAGDGALHSANDSMALTSDCTEMPKPPTGIAMYT